ncbi:MAG: DUF4360 domain-containing protein [Oligoflexia bacterium]|nr:DUF4360 domain-containing protein [Oligoflexia bacterium]
MNIPLKIKIKKTTPISLQSMIFFSLLFSLLLFPLVSMSSVLADEPIDIRLGTPTYAGTGCPMGTASARLSPDARSFHILFDQYVAHAGRSAGVALNRKSCNLAIPVAVPPGYSIALYEIDRISGFLSLPSEAEAEFYLEYFFAGSKGPIIHRMWQGPTHQEYFISNIIASSAIVWSPCGQSVNLRMNTNILVKTNSTMEDAMATVERGIAGKIQWRFCH